MYLQDILAQFSGKTKLGKENIWIIMDKKKEKIFKKPNQHITGL
jgi:hypothetical protein